MAFQQPTENPLRHRMTELGKEAMEIASWGFNVKEAYNLGYIYVLIHDWLVEEGWAPRDKDADFNEVSYLQRDNPNFGKELRIRWRLEQPGFESKQLFSYLMDLEFYTLGLKDTEIVYKGNKVKTDSSEFELKCTAYLVLDKDGFIGKSIFKDFKKLLYDRWIKAQTVRHKQFVYVSAYRLRDFIADYFKQPVILGKEGAEYFRKRTLE